MHIAGLAVVVLHDVTVGPVQNAWGPVSEGRRVIARCGTATTGFNADQSDGGVFDERIEHASGIAAPSDTRDDGIGKPTETRLALLSAFGADDALEVADHHREGVRPDHRADDVMGVFDARHPIAHGFVDGVAERARTAFDGTDFGSHQPHAKHVGLLTADIFGPHIDDAGQAKVGARRRRRDTVLPGSGLRDDACLFHTQGQQRLAERIVDLVRAGVIQVLALEPNLCAAELLAQPFGVVERGWSTDETLQQFVQFCVKVGIGFGLGVLRGEFLERPGECFRDESAAKHAESTACIRDLLDRRFRRRVARLEGAHGGLFS